MAKRTYMPTDPNERAVYCQRCGERLNPATAVWLELDQRTETYTDANDVPAETSQGWFSFGAACAKRERSEHARAKQ